MARTAVPVLTAAAVVLGSASLSVWLLHPLSTRPGSSVFDASTLYAPTLTQPDVNLNTWILAWGAHALETGRLAGFYDANIFHPEPSSLAYSESMLGVLPLHAPLYWASADAVLAFNLWMLSTFVLCALAMYAVAWRWFDGHAAAAVAAMLWAFSPLRFTHLVHAQALSVQYLPLLAAAAWSAGSRRGARAWLALAGLAALQALSSFYLGYAGFLVAGMAGLAALLAQPGGRARRALGLASALGVAALLLVPASLPYLALDRAGLLRGAPMVAAPWAYLWASFYPEVPGGGRVAWGMWLAAPPLALLGLGLGAATPRYRARAFALAGLVVVGALLAMGPGASLLGLRVGALHDLAGRVVPGWSSLRVYGRFALVAWLGVSLLACLPFAAGVRGTARLPWQRGAMAGLLVAGLAVSASRLEIRTLPRLEAVRDTTPYRWLAAHGEGDPVLEWPLQFGRIDSEYVALSTLHWHPLVNGYSGYRPPSNELVAALAASLPAPAATRSLVGLAIARWLVVHTRRPGFGARRWEELERLGARLRLAHAETLLFELPFRRETPSPLRSPPPRAATLLGTPTRRLDAAELDAQIEVLEPEIHSDGRNRWLDLRVRNASAVRWPGLAVPRDGLVGVSFEIRRAGAAARQPLPGFARLPTDLAPGEATQLGARLYPPRADGDYELVPCLEQWRRGSRRCFEHARALLRVRTASIRPDAAPATRDAAATRRR